jgi:hypothetical protein
MNVAIIAASLVVMRPCFAFIYGLIFGHKQQDSYPSNQRYFASDYSGKSQENKITKTIDIMLSTRPVSQERILPPLQERVLPDSLK